MISVRPTNLLQPVRSSPLVPGLLEIVADTSHHPLQFDEPVTPPRKASQRKSSATLRAQESRQSTPYRTPRTPSTTYGTPISRPGGAGPDVSFDHLHLHQSQPAAEVEDSEGQSGNALVVLSETLASTSRFLGTLKRLDAAPNDRPSNTAADAAAAGASTGGGDIEERLQAHLGLMHDADRRAEEHLRILTSVERDLSTAAMDSVDWSDVWEEDEQGEEGEDPGWTGSGSNVQPIHPPDSPVVELSPPVVDPVDDETDEDDQRLDEEMMDDPFSPVEPLHSSSTLRPPKLRVHSAEPALPRTVKLVQADTADLLVALTGLGETLHLSGAVYSSVQRQMRGIRAGIDSWREREEQEAAAWTAVELYDRERVQRGLTGENTRERVKREMDGFAECLEGLTKQLRPIAT